MARLVALQQDHVPAQSGEMEGRGRSGGAGPNDDRVNRASGHGSKAKEGRGSDLEDFRFLLRQMLFQRNDESIRDFLDLVLLIPQLIFR